MTNATSKQKMTGNFSLATDKISDEAPMAVNRLSGWIGSNNPKAPTAAWITPTRVRAAT